MGRWTPLILMAGGLAILLGTLLGISFPLGGQNNAQAPKPESTTGKASKVLPANINVNSTAGSGSGSTSNNNKGSVVQSSPNDTTNTDTTPNNTQNNPNNTETQTSDANQSNEPVRALW